MITARIPWVFANALRPVVFRSGEESLMLKKIAIMAASAALALLIAGCAAEEPAQPEQGGEGQAAGEVAALHTFVDDAGNEVVVESANRVVACMGSFANMWELAGGVLVGCSDDAFTFDSFDIASPGVQKVGDFSGINLEAVIALEPDFVIMTCGTGGRGGDSSQLDLAPALEASGIPVAYFEVTTFADYERMMGVLCEITGREDLYQANVADVRAQIDALVAEVPAGEAPSVLCMTTYSGGTRVQSSATMTGAMLAELGVANLADENRSLLSDFSLESIIELDPDFIFVIPMGNDAEAAMAGLEQATAANPAWATLTAVQEDRYVALDPNLFLYKPNANWADAYQFLFDTLYGQAS